MSTYIIVKGGIYPTPNGGTRTVAAGERVSGHHWEQFLRYGVVRKEAVTLPNKPMAKPRTPVLDTDFTTAADAEDAAGNMRIPVKPDPAAAEVVAALAPTPSMEVPAIAAEDRIAKIDSLVKMHTSATLKGMCDLRGLPAYGSKIVLATRIVDYEDKA
jgi:hypothetical protein